MTQRVRELDEAAGLMYYRARYYDSAVGTFVSKDPLGFDAGDANLYRYVFNSPTNFTDPSGKFIATLAPAFTLGGPPGWAIGAGIVVVGVGAAYLLNRSQNTASSARSTDWDFSNAAASNAFPSITATDPREFDPNRGVLTPSAPIDLPNNTAYPQPDVEGVNDAGPFDGGFCEDLSDILGETTNPFPIPQIDPRDFIFDSSNIDDSHWDDLESFENNWENPVARAVQHILADNPDRIQKLGLNDAVELKEVINNVYYNPQETWIRDDRYRTRAYVRLNQGIFIDNPANPTLIPPRSDYARYLARSGFIRD
ncbi:RHS repeat-associated core domain-containing protein [Leptothoe sp. EHU-05/26/07-4]